MISGYRVQNTTINITVPTFPLQSVLSVNNWIVMQQIVDAPQSFNRPWSDFKAGFGTYNGNFWLGLEKIYQMTNSGSYRFRIEVMTTTWKWFSAEYDSFSISPESSQYKLSISGYSGDTGDVMLDRRSNGVGYLLSMPFSTYDRNNRKQLRRCPRMWLVAQPMFLDQSWWTLLFPLLARPDFEPQNISHHVPYDDETSIGKTPRRLLHQSGISGVFRIS